MNETTNSEERLFVHMRFPLGILIFFGGCDMFVAEKNNQGVSQDINALQHNVKISVPAKTVKWEIFGTPEDKGTGAPGPTDYLTLVAQVQSDDSNWFERNKEKAGKVWIAPESARPWLSPYFQGLLTTSNADLSNKINCKKYHAQLTKIGKPVDGFVCEYEGLLLIHLMLLGPTSQNSNKLQPPAFE